MDLLPLMRDKRFSVRKFKNQPVEKEKLSLILEAGRVAPTGCNYQPQRILVIENQDAKEKLKQCTSFDFGAPVILLICYDKTTCWKITTNGTIGGEQDACIVTTQMMLQAAAIGLGSTWVGAFNHQKAREVFNIPDYLVPVALLPIGYPAEDAAPAQAHFNRFDLDHTVFFNSFDGIKEGKEHGGFRL